MNIFREASCFTPLTRRFGSHVSPEFIEEFGQALEKLRAVFLTEKGQPFVLAGSGKEATIQSCGMCDPF